MRGLIDKAIASHPRDRYSSAKEMLQALRSYLIPSTPITSTPQPAATVLSPPIIQNTVPIASANVPRPVNQVNQGSGQKGIIISSVIIGGLIGTSVLLVFAV